MNKLNKILILLIFARIIIFNSVNTQDCSPEYTYFESLPENINNINNDSNCFSNIDLTVISDLVSINDMSYTTPLEVGPQTWVSGRIVIWVATYTPNGVNGVNMQITSLPDNIGNLENLATFYLEWNNLTSLPISFSELTNLSSLAISNNYLNSLPEDFGNLSDLVFLDLGYNLISSIPESIGNLQNIEYLWLFNNQISSLPESICDLPLVWSGVDGGNYPFFAIGGNLLCDDELIPDCVSNSDNFEISLEQFYYSFLIEVPQDCCPPLGDLNGDGGWNVLDIVTLANCILSANCAELEFGCAGDINMDGGYNVLDIVTLANCILGASCSDL